MPCSFAARMAANRSCFFWHLHVLPPIRGFGNALHPSILAACLFLLGIPTKKALIIIRENGIAKVQFDKMGAQYVL